MAKSSNSSERKKKKSKLLRKVNDFSQSVGLSPSKIIVAGVLLLGIGYLIYAVAFSDQDSKDVAAKPSEFKLQQRELGVDQRLAAMIDQKAAAGQNFLAIIDQVNDLEVELDSIESKPGLSDAQKNLIDRIRIRNKGVIVALMSNNKVPCDRERTQLYQFCTERINSADKELAEQANYWLCTIPAIEFRESPSPETLQSFTTAVETYPAGYLNSPSNAGNLSAMMLKMSRESPNAKEYWKKGFNVLSKRLVTSDVDAIKQMSKRLDALEMFGEFNLFTLKNRILWGNPSGPKDLEGAMAVLAEHPESELIHWVTIIKAYESFLSTDKIEETGAAWQKMSELTKSIVDSEKKQQLQEILAKQRKRAMSIGTHFDPSGTMLPDGDSFVLGKHDYTAIIFCNKTNSSFAAMINLAKERQEGQIPYHPVLTFDQELTQADLDSLHQTRKDVSVADRATSKKYYEALPVDFFPYVILLDKSGTIVSANLDVQQIPARVAKFEKIKRDQRAANSEGESEPATISP